MKRLAALAAALLALAAAAAPIRVVDDAGRPVELPRPARRIATLAPFLTELAYSAGAGARIVGASAFSDYPEQARALPQVASAAGIEIERLVALQPDLVLAWRDTIRDEEVRRLERFGMAVFVARARALADVPRLLGAVAVLAGGSAQTAADEFRRRIEAQRRAHAGVPRLPVFLEVWHQPLTTIAGAHWINEALDVCGAENVFAVLPGVAPGVPWEALYARDPPVIVGAGSAASEPALRAAWADRSALAAVRAGRIVHVEGDLLLRPTARLADGVERLCARLDAVRATLP